MRTRLLVGVLAVTAFGCDDCSERAQGDLRTIGALNLHLGLEYANSWDAGVAEVARLEALYQPVLEVRADTVGALAGVPDAAVTASADEGHVTLVVRVETFGQARQLVNELQRRGTLVDRVTVLDAGLRLDVSAYDLEALRWSPRPPFNPAPPDQFPCFSECLARQREIVEKRDLLEAFDTSLPRLRQLKRLQQWRDGEDGWVPTPAVRVALDAVLDGGVREGTRLRAFDRGQRLLVCGAGWAVADCAGHFGAGATCTASPYCAHDAGCADPANGPCGFEVSFSAGP